MEYTMHECWMLKVQNIQYFTVNCSSYVGIEYLFDTHFGETTLD